MSTSPPPPAGHLDPQRDFFFARDGPAKTLIAFMQSAALGQLQTCGAILGQAEARLQACDRSFSYQQHRHEENEENENENGSGNTATATNTTSANADNSSGAEKTKKRDEGEGEEDGNGDDDAWTRLLQLLPSHSAASPDNNNDGGGDMTSNGSNNEPYYVKDALGRRAGDEALLPLMRSVVAAMGQRSLRLQHQTSSPSSTTAATTGGDGANNNKKKVPYQPHLLPPPPLTKTFRVAPSPLLPTPEAAAYVAAMVNAAQPPTSRFGQGPPPSLPLRLHVILQQLVDTVPAPPPLSRPTTKEQTSQQEGAGTPSTTAVSSPTNRSSGVIAPPAMDAFGRIERVACARAAIAALGARVLDAPQLDALLNNDGDDAHHFNSNSSMTGSGNNGMPFGPLAELALFVLALHDDEEKAAATATTVEAVAEEDSDNHGIHYYDLRRHRQSKHLAAVAALRVLWAAVRPVVDPQSYQHFADTALWPGAGAGVGAGAGAGGVTTTAGTSTTEALSATTTKDPYGTLLQCARLVSVFPPDTVVFSGVGSTTKNNSGGGGISLVVPPLEVWAFPAPAMATTTSDNNTPSQQDEEEGPPIKKGEDEEERLQEVLRTLHRCSLGPPPSLTTASMTMMTAPADGEKNKEEDGGGGDEDDTTGRPLHPCACVVAQLAAAVERCAYRHGLLHKIAFSPNLHHRHQAVDTRQNTNSTAGVDDPLYERHLRPTLHTLCHGYGSSDTLSPMELCAAVDWGLLPSASPLSSTTVGGVSSTANTAAPLLYNGDPLGHLQAYLVGHYQQSLQPQSSASSPSSSSTVPAAAPRMPLYTLLKSLLGPKHMRCWRPVVAMLLYGSGSGKNSGSIGGVSSSSHDPSSSPSLVEAVFRGPFGQKMTSAATAARPMTVAEHALVIDFLLGGSADDVVPASHQQTTTAVRSSTIASTESSSHHRPSAAAVAAACPSFALVFERMLQYYVRMAECVGAGGGTTTTTTTCNPSTGAVFLLTLLQTGGDVLAGLAAALGTSTTAASQPLLPSSPSPSSPSSSSALYAPLVAQLAKHTDDYWQHYAAGPLRTLQPLHHLYLHKTQEHEQQREQSEKETKKEKEKDDDEESSSADEDIDNGGAAVDAGLISDLASVAAATIPIFAPVAEQRCLLHGMLLEVAALALSYSSSSTSVPPQPLVLQQQQQQQEQRLDGYIGAFFEAVGAYQSLLALATTTTREVEVEGVGIDLEEQQRREERSEGGKTGRKNAVVIADAVIDAAVSTVAAEVLLPALTTSMTTATSVESTVAFFCFLLKTIERHCSSSTNAAAADGSTRSNINSVETNNNSKKMGTVKGKASAAVTTTTVTTATVTASTATTASTPLLLLSAAALASLRNVLFRTQRLETYLQTHRRHEGQKDNNDGDDDDDKEKKADNTAVVPTTTHAASSSSSHLLDVLTADPSALLVEAAAGGGDETTNNSNGSSGGGGMRHAADIIAHLYQRPCGGGDNDDDNDSGGSDDGDDPIENSASASSSSAAAAEALVFVFVASRLRALRDAASVASTLPSAAGAAEAEKSSSVTSSHRHQQLLEWAHALVAALHKNKNNKNSSSNNSGDGKDDETTAVCTAVVAPHIQPQDLWFHIPHLISAFQEHNTSTTTTITNSSGRLEAAMAWLSTCSSSSNTNNMMTSMDDSSVGSGNSGGSAAQDYASAALFLTSASLRPWAAQALSDPSRWGELAFSLGGSTTASRTPSIASSLNKNKIHNTKPQAPPAEQTTTVAAAVTTTSTTPITDIPIRGAAIDVFLQRLLRAVGRVARVAASGSTATADLVDAAAEVTALVHSVSRRKGTTTKTKRGDDDNNEEHCSSPYLLELPWKPMLMPHHDDEGNEDRMQRDLQVSYLTSTAVFIDALGQCLRGLAQQLPEQRLQQGEDSETTTSSTPTISTFHTRLREYRDQADAFTNADFCLRHALPFVYAAAASGALLLPAHNGSAASALPATDATSTATAADNVDDADAWIARDLLLESAPPTHHHQPHNVPSSSSLLSRSWWGHLLSASNATQNKDKKSSPVHVTTSTGDNPPIKPVDLIVFIINAFIAAQPTTDISSNTSVAYDASVEANVAATLELLVAVHNEIANHNNNNLDNKKGYAEGSPPSLAPPPPHLLHATVAAELVAGSTAFALHHIDRLQQQQQQHYSSTHHSAALSPAPFVSCLNASVFAAAMETRRQQMAAAAIAEAADRILLPSHCSPSSTTSTCTTAGDEDRCCCSPWEVVVIATVGTATGGASQKLPAVALRQRPRNSNSSKTESTTAAITTTPTFVAVTRRVVEAYYNKAASTPTESEGTGEGGVEGLRVLCFALLDTTAPEVLADAVRTVLFSSSCSSGDGTAAGAGAEKEKGDDPFKNKKDDYKDTNKDNTTNNSKLLPPNKDTRREVLLDLLLQYLWQSQHDNSYSSNSNTNSNCMRLQSYLANNNSGGGSCSNHLSIWSFPEAIRVLLPTPTTTTTTTSSTPASPSVQHRTHVASLLLPLLLQLCPSAGPSVLLPAAALHRAVNALTPSTAANAAPFAVIAACVPPDAQRRCLQLLIAAVEGAVLNAESTPSNLSDNINSSNYPTDDGHTDGDGIGGGGDVDTYLDLLERLHHRVAVLGTVDAAAEALFDGSARSSSSSIPSTVAAFPHLLHLQHKAPPRSSSPSSVVRWAHAIALHAIRPVLVSSSGDASTDDNTGNSSLFAALQSLCHDIVSTATARPNNSNNNAAAASPSARAATIARLSARFGAAAQLMQALRSVLTPQITAFGGSGSSGTNSSSSSSSSPQLQTADIRIALHSNNNNKTSSVFGYPSQLFPALSAEAEGRRRRARRQQRGENNRNKDDDNNTNNSNSGDDNDENDTNTNNNNMEKNDNSRNNNKDSSGLHRPFYDRVAMVRSLVSEPPTSSAADAARCAALFLFAQIQLDLLLTSSAGSSSSSSSIYSSSSSSQRLLQAVGSRLLARVSAVVESEFTVPDADGAPMLSCEHFLDEVAASAAAAAGSAGAVKQQQQQVYGRSDGGASNTHSNSNSVAAVTCTTWELVSQLCTSDLVPLTLQHRLLTYVTTSGSHLLRALFSSSLSSNNNSSSNAFVERWRRLGTGIGTMRMLLDRQRRENALLKEYRAACKGGGCTDGLSGGGAAALHDEKSSKRKKNNQSGAPSSNGSGSSSNSPSDSGVDEGEDDLYDDPCDDDLDQRNAHNKRSGGGEYHRRRPPTIDSVFGRAFTSRPLLLLENLLMCQRVADVVVVLPVVRAGGPALDRACDDLLLRYAGLAVDISAYARLPPDVFPHGKSVDELGVGGGASPRHDHQHHDDSSSKNAGGGTDHDSHHQSGPLRPPPLRCWIPAEASPAEAEAVRATFVYANSPNLPLYRQILRSCSDPDRALTASFDLAESMFDRLGQCTNDTSRVIMIDTAEHVLMALDPPTPAQRRLLRLFQISRHLVLCGWAQHPRRADLDSDATVMALIQDLMRANHTKAAFAVAEACGVDIGGVQAMWAGRVQQLLELGLYREATEAMVHLSQSRIRDVVQHVLESAQYAPVVSGFHVVRALGGQHSVKLMAEPDVPMLLLQRRKGISALLRKHGTRLDLLDFVVGVRDWGPAISLALEIRREQPEEVSARLVRRCWLQRSTADLRAAMKDRDPTLGALQPLIVQCCQVFEQDGRLEELYAWQLWYKDFSRAAHTAMLLSKAAKKYSDKMAMVAEAEQHLLSAKIQPAVRLPEMPVADDGTELPLSRLNPQQLHLALVQCRLQQQLLGCLHAANLDCNRFSIYGVDVGELVGTGAELLYLGKGFTDVAIAIIDAMHIDAEACVRTAATRLLDEGKYDAAEGLIDSIKKFMSLPFAKRNAVWYAIMQLCFRDVTPSSSSSISSSSHQKRTNKLAQRALGLMTAEGGRRVLGLLLFEKYTEAMDEAIANNDFQAVENVYETASRAPQAATSAEIANVLNKTRLYLTRNRKY